MSKCKTCKEEIIYAKANNGKFIIIEAKSMSEDDINFLLSRDKNTYNDILSFKYGVHIPHFINCQNVNI